MEFNRLVSLVLGFIVLILAFVWINNRFRATNTTTKTNQPTITITPTEESEKQNTKWNPFSFLFNNKTPTPTKALDEISTTTDGKTPTPTPQTQVQVKIIEKGGLDNDSPSEKNTSNNVYNQNSVQQIPETGAATMLIPVLSLMLAGGIAIKKSS